MSSARGFSLIEVLIAAALLAVALLAIAGVFPAAYGRVDRSGEQTTAVSLAQQRIEWLRNQPYDNLIAGTTNDALTGDYVGYQRVTDIQQDVPEIGIKQVTVTILTPGGRVVDLTSLVAD